jgi:flagellar biosynthetic protein FliR
MPLFGASNIPMQVRIVLIMLLTGLIYPVASVFDPAGILSLWDLSFHILMETLIGLSISIAMAIVYNAIYLAGMVVDTNIGFSMVNVISATDETEIPLTANLFYIMAIMLFLISNAHHRVLEAIWQCFKVIPLGQGFLNLGIIDIFNMIFVQSFIIGIKISAPFLLTILVADVILGLLSKAMPGFNVFMVGMPAKILIGFSMLYIMIPYISRILVFINELTIEYFYDVIEIYQRSGI